MNIGDYGKAAFPGGVSRFDELVKPEVSEVELGEAIITLAQDQELQAGLLDDEDEELMRRIFEPSERVTRVGSAVPSEAMLAEYFSWLDHAEACRRIAELSARDLLVD